jgi:hypothetical protein
MARIGNNTIWNNYKVVFQEKVDKQAQTQTYYRLIMNGTNVLANETVADTTNGPNTSTLLGYIMSDATSTQSGQSNLYLTQVFSSSNHFVFLYKVSYPTETIVNLGPLHSPISYGQKALIVGNLTDTNGNPLPGPLTVDIEYSTDVGTTWNKVETIPVNQNGSFNYTWTPDVGNYTLRAHFLGVQGAYVSSVALENLLVKKANATITLTASTTTPAVGQNVLLNWHVEPFVSGANITISYTSDNKTFVKIVNLIMTSPSMNYSWKVTASGTFRIVLTINGDKNYNLTAASLIVKTV